jgi:hypothetical protein
MLDWFDVLASGHALSPAEEATLLDDGFLVLPDLVRGEPLEQLRRAYDAAAASAVAADVRVGSATTRISDFVNRGADFDQVYVFPPLLQACCRIIGRPFKLSSLLGRTLRPQTPVSDLHVDVQRDSADWPLAAFILMIDEFRSDNGATRFVPGSHGWPRNPEDALPDVKADYPGQRLACGPAGSLLIFNGSAWHGHTANVSSAPRRSLQGAFIPRDGRAGTDFAARMRPDTLARLSPIAKYVLAI